MFFYIIVVIIAVILIYTIIQYNLLIKARNNVKEAFSTMDVYLKKRWDLIPNLVETVKGYTKHESESLEKIVKLRSASYDSLSSEDKIKTNKELSNAITKVLAVAENYPDLKANTNFINLSNELSHVEEDIANSRKYYNAVVRSFNNLVEVFPNNIVAGIFNFKAKSMFEIDASNRENVKVEF